MRRLVIHRRGYHRKGYRRRDGRYVRPCYVHPTTFHREDVGKRGRTPEEQRWFDPLKHRDWHKTDNATTRRRKLLASTDKRRNNHERYLEAARAIQALANVTADKETRKLAKADANYFFEKARRT